MQTLMIPQSPIVDSRGMMPSEWLVFFNEFIRLSNLVISSDTINQAADAAMIASGFRYTVDVERDEIIQNVTVTANSKSKIENVALAITQDEVIQNTAIQITQDDQQQDNPYALISSIEQQLYDQQIWSLNA